MVIYEAAHAIVNMKDTSARELAPAVSVLQLFLSSPKPTLRFAATKTLNKVCQINLAGSGLKDAVLVSTMDRSTYLCALIQTNQVVS